MTPEPDPTSTASDQESVTRVPRTRPVASLQRVDTAAPVDDTSAANQDFVDWLVDQSMLRDAIDISRQFAASSAMWQNPYADPDPRAAIATTSVWFTAYPISMLTRPGESFLASLADDALWAAFEEIGITGLHTGPVKIAGGLTGRTWTPSTDGHFDRISTRIDPAFGTEEEFRAMVASALFHGGTILDDLVPAHTGKGPDFRLAEMAHGDYPGIFHMVEIAREHWDLLPEIAPGRDCANLDTDTERRLEEVGYIVGPMQRVIFGDPGVKDTNWSATGEVLGVDGNVRRWVYLHYFKEGQPSLNWIDPTFAAARLVIGDALHSLGDLGAGALRLDANGFLGVERSMDGSPAWSEGHPLSEAANHLIAATVRKMGGFSFQELNLTIGDIRDNAERGADLSYDFVTRPAYHHALATGDTEFLRLTLNAARDIGVEPVQLVHALQNHDELTWELVHFEERRTEHEFSFRGHELTGAELASLIRGDLARALVGDAAPYNAVFTTQGIASTTVTVVAAALGYRDLAALTAAQIEEITQAHVLLAKFNAWQPGVFALSGWDLCGMLTLPRDQVADLLAGGDMRWIHRSAYDLMGATPDTVVSNSGMPRGRSLYGSLPDQLNDANSFASRLRRMLEVRSTYGIASGTQLDVPEVDQPAVLVLVHGLEDGTQQVTALNFSREILATTVSSPHLPAGALILDMTTGEELGTVTAQGIESLRLGSFMGRALHIRPA